MSQVVNANNPHIGVLGEPLEAPVKVVWVNRCDEHPITCRLNTEFGKRRLKFCLVCFEHGHDALWQSQRAATLAGFWFARADPTTHRGERFDHTQGAPLEVEWVTCSAREMLTYFCHFPLDSTLAAQCDVNSFLISKPDLFAGVVAVIRRVPPETLW